MLKGLENMACGENLKELGLFMSRKDMIQWRYGNSLQIM